uniref:Major capsid protein N-terminal domain-containing protein n=1 Tax=viral metagenome TaxID=1070528 RepID=A0A6C0JPW7_9ZZZZ
MTGGLMQLVNKGAQDILVTGNPSFTHFKSVYKRHTEFAMEHFRLFFKTTNLSLPPSGSLTLRAKVERYAQLLHDCYLSITLPDIYSPVIATSTPAQNLNPSSNAIGYEFQWIHNIGYNMINYVSININGSEIVRHTGEWMKIYANLKFDANKKALLEQLVGNIPELYDPANAFDRLSQYPHAITTNTNIAAPSINGRVLTIPLHFWFCETVGKALPLIAMQYSEVEIIVDLKNMFQLYTVIDVNSSSSTYGQRVAPSSSMTPFLSPPLSVSQLPSNPSLITWNLNPFVECNYIFVSDAEMAHIASSDHSYVINQVDVREGLGHYGPSNDLELNLRNLCTRIAWVCQRNDRFLVNDFDNYTNWENPYEPPIGGPLPFVSLYYTSGIAQQSGITARDILLESAIIIDGKERFNYKQTEFFKYIQNYRHETGRTITDLPGIYTYSFALENDKEQPSGHINGSQFNKTILRNTFVQPPLLSGTLNPSGTALCVLKSTANLPNPTIVNPIDYANNSDLIVTIYRKTANNTLIYAYNVRAFVESYNFLRVIGGIANVVFSS